LTIDMRTNAGVQRAFASPPTALILLGTLRLCVVGKNYRLQDIQLSKIIRGKTPSDNCRWPRDFSPGPPSARPLVGPQSPAPLLAASRRHATRFSVRCASSAGTSYSTRLTRPMQARRSKNILPLPAATAFCD